MIANLMALVSSVGFQQGGNLLQNALRAVNAGQVGAACNQIAAFINQVQAQAGKKQLTSDQADQLIRAATQIRSALGCS